jgi:hypothetical protein
MNLNNFIKLIVLLVSILVLLIGGLWSVLSTNDTQSPKILCSVGVFMLTIVTLWHYNPWSEPDERTSGSSHESGRSFGRGRNTEGSVAGKSSPDLVASLNKVAAACESNAATAVELGKHLARLNESVAAHELRAEVELLEKEIIENKKHADSVKLELASAYQNHDKTKLLLIDANKVLAALKDELLLVKQDRDAIQGRLDALDASYAEKLKNDSDRLGRIVPAGLEKSHVFETIKECSEKAASGDRVAAQIFASLQSIKAAQDDEQLKGLLLSSLQVLGQSLSRLADRSDFSSQEKNNLFNEWASAMNEISASRYTLTVPSLGARINLTTMVSSGSDDGTVTAVHCWGIRNEKGDLAYLAEIS